MPKGLRRFAPPLLLFLLNAILIHRVFAAEYLVFRGSIECTYIALARYVIAHFPDLSWLPLWYGGIPFQNAYAPLLYSMTALWSLIARITPALAYHQIVAIIYCAGPPVLYWLLRRLGASKRGAILAGILYALVSPAAVLLQAVRADAGSRWNPRRLQILLAYGEGPHELALIFLPLAILALDRLIERRTPARLVLAVLSVAAVALSNWLGAFALALAIAGLLMARRVDLRSLMAVSVTGILAYGLACPWLPPWTIATVQRNSRLLMGDNYHPKRILILAALCIAGLLLSRLPMARRIPAPYWFFGFFATVTATLLVTSFRYHYAIVPQAERYQLEFDLAMCGLAGLAADWILRRTPKFLILAAVAWFGIVGCGQIWRLYWQGLDYGATIDASKFIEERDAGWMKRNIPDGRVFAPGSVGFWLDAWDDIPQISGDFNNGIFNWETVVAEYIIQSGDGAGANDAEISRIWLEAFGARAIALSEPNGTEVYKPMANPKKFAGVLPEAWRDGGDAIYLVDRVGGGLAHIVPKQAVIAKAPENGIDVAQMRTYVTALEASDPAIANMHWPNQHTIVVAARTSSPDDVLSVQESWHPGWQAFIGDHPVTLHPDGLGLMVVEPDRTGAFDVRLEYRPPQWPWAVCAGSMLLLGGAGLVLRRTLNTVDHD